MSKKRVREMRFMRRLTGVWTQKHPHVGMADSGIDGKGYRTRLK